MPRLFVVKRNGGRQEFSREKVLSSMVLAAGKRPVPLERLEIAADKIERDLLGLLSDEVTTVEIGRRVMAELSVIDTVAYVRFASVYQEFETVSDFTALVERVQREEVNARFAHLQDALL